MSRRFLQGHKFDHTVENGHGVHERDGDEDRGLSEPWEWR